MSHHCTVHSFVNQILKWNEFYLFNFFYRILDYRKSVMRVGGSVAMTREMLHRRNHAIVLKRKSVSSTFTRHIIRIFTETTITYNWIIRFVIHVDIRSEVHVDTYTQTLLCNLTSHFCNKRIVGYSTQCHLIRI